MAIQFPPIFPNDPLPVDKETFVDVETGNVWIYSADYNSWTLDGLMDYGTFSYRGRIRITEPTPLNTDIGFIYSVEDGGVAHISFIGLAGQDIPQWSSVVLGPQGVWSLAVPINPDTVPFVQNGQDIVPTKLGSNLDMLGGNLVISSFDSLP